MMEAVTVEMVEGVEVAAEVDGVVSRGAMTGMEVGAAEVDWVCRHPQLPIGIL